MSKIVSLKYGLVAWAMLACFQAQAHDPNQITYNFNEAGQLKIHLTPKGAFDILQYIRPDLAAESVIRLSDYYPVFTDYFNETIELSLAGHAIDFAFLEADLGKHDATISFKLLDFPGNYDAYTLSVRSFTELYRRVNNMVNIPGQGGNHTFVLDDEDYLASYEQVVLSAKRMEEAASGEKGKYSWIFFLVSAALGLLLAIVGSYRLLETWQ